MRGGAPYDTPQDLRPGHRKEIVRPMNRTSFLAAIAIVAAVHVHAADDNSARIAVTQAIAKQKALPGYIEHQFGRLPIMPMMVEADEPPLRRPAESPDAEPVIEWGSEQEITTIEHAGGRERLSFGYGQGEIVRGGGQTAYKFIVPAQVAAQMSALAADSGDQLAQNEQSSVKAIRGLSKALAHGASMDIVGAAIGALDEVAQMVSQARSTAEILKANAMLARVSDVWQCKPDDAPHAPSAMLSVEPMPDRSIGRVRAHVYSVVWSADSSNGGYQFEGHLWIGITDGLPLRLEAAFPGGSSMRTEFEYPETAPDIPTPQCPAPRS